MIAGVTSGVSLATRSRHQAFEKQAKLRWCRKALLTWYKREGRKFAWRADDASAFQRIVSEILLQRTQAGTVDRFFASFFERFTDWRDIHSACEETVGESLKAIGLWRRRAIALKALAAEMVGRNGEFPAERTQLEALPAIGQYVASAVLLFVHGRPSPLLDSSMARLLERLFRPRKLADIRYDPELQALAHEFFRSRRSIELNWAALDVAALFCRRANPVCSTCPLQKKCNYARSQAALTGRSRSR
ncbi:hypothetical protein [Bradyrhizobium sp. 613_E4_N2_2]|uniref:hypothetical protein n=1 Tax=Bradyrhizobium sp. 613_E4_N2_2 TaxID=3240371 RepID=UPI003F89D291